MNTHPTIFSGNTKIYLQGNCAIGEYNLLHDRALLYIGSKKSGIVVADYRAKTISFLKQLADGNTSPHGFTEYFNLNGLVQVKLLGPESDQMDIQIHDSNIQETPKKMLWLGVIWDRTIPAYEVIWEKFETISIPNEKGETSEAIAFVCLLKDDV